MSANAGTSSHEAVTILKVHGNAVEEFLRALPHRYPDAPPRLMEAVQYSLMAGGKRFRPALVLECARACGEANPHPNPATLAGAAAIELIHTFSLVHDDLPAMDDDDLRRGRPTNHKVYGEAMAILAGDGMVAMAFEILAEDCSPTIGPRMIIELARATGPAGMIGGQVLDMAGEGKSLSLEQLQRVHRSKTGALITAACRMGGVAAGADDSMMRCLSEFGRRLGLAFQIVDDILDVTSTPEQLGKGTGKDAGRGKNTYPGLLGLERSQSMAREELAGAIDALNGLGSYADGLKAIAQFVADRTV